MATQTERKEVFTIIDKGENEKGWWVRIGTAFVNRDGSLNVVLDALPVNGKMHIRDRLPEDDRRDRDEQPRSDTRGQRSYRDRDNTRGGGR